MGPSTVVERYQTIEQLVKKCGFKTADIAACGIGTPGPADYTAGLSSIQQYATFKNVPIRKMLSDACIARSPSITMRMWPAW